jgi:hypothetical protein
MIDDETLEMEVLLFKNTDPMIGLKGSRPDWTVTDTCRSDGWGSDANPFRIVVRVNTVTDVANNDCSMTVVSMILNFRPIRSKPLYTDSKVQCGNLKK